MPLYQLNGQNLLFIHVPKTGGKSVEEFFKALSGGQALFHPRKQNIFPCSPQHMHADALQLLFGKHFLHHSFMVVRNPFRRFVSEYHWRITRKNGEQPFAAWAGETLDRLKDNPFLLDNHLRPQVEFQLEGTVVHKLEDGLIHAVRAAVQAVGIEMDVPELRQTHKTTPTEVSAGQDIVERLRETYAVDFSTFGYDPFDLSDAFKVV